LRAYRITFDPTKERRKNFVFFCSFTLQSANRTDS